MRWVLAFGVLAVVATAWANEADLPPESHGAIAFDVDVCSFQWQGREGFEEVTLQFPVAQFAFQRAGAHYVARYQPSLRVLDAAGHVIRQVETESRMTAESLDATTEPGRVFLDMVQVKLPPGAYRGELTLRDLNAGRSGKAAFDIQVPAYDSDALGMSDLYLASGFNPPHPSAHLKIFEKGGRIAVPDPARTYDAHAPLFFYFEIYHLGLRAHEVQMQVQDRYGHAVWDDRRAFPGFRDEARFAEGVPLNDLPPGVYTLKVTVTAGREQVHTARKFRVLGSAPTPDAAFDAQAMRAARALLAQFGGKEAAGAFDALGRTERARYLYGFWMQRNRIVARAYYAPLLGYGWPRTSPALLKGIGLARVLAHRVDAAYVARLADPDTAGAREARAVLKALLKKDPDDLLAQCAVGYAYFEGGDLPYGEQTLKDAHARGGVLPEIINGLGLAHMGRKDWAAAEAAFNQALALRSGWSTARANRQLARFLSGKADEQGALDSLLALAPFDPAWWYAKGRIREREGDLAGAEVAYARQASVNPAHVHARFDLGRIWFRQGRYTGAISVWQALLDSQPAWRDACMEPLLSAYLKAGDTAGAQAAIAAYLRTVDDTTRALMQDIRLVASNDELQAYDALSPEARPAFVRAFWQKRDPTPATPGNERLVEHYRRVLHAMTYFSRGQKPWDKRGDIYIRYGPPAHVSKSSDVRFETDPDVIKVKDRLWMGLSPEARKEIVARMGRLRTSMRDVSYGSTDATDVEISDFESIDFELNPNREFFGGGSGRNDGQYYDDTQDSQRDRGQGTQILRGYPVFPIDSTTRWEYWIYPDVAGGIEIDFTALDARGAFGFPDMPQGRALSNYNQGVWISRRPDRVVAEAIARQAEVYRPRTKDLAFYFDNADFRGDSTRSRLEVYYGVPLDTLVDSAHASGQVMRGIALFDSSWAPVYRKTAPLPFAVADTLSRGTLLIDQVALNVPPGTYHLGVEVQDRARHLAGAYTRDVRVESYAGSGLRLSDIELAGSVTADPSASLKGGRKVLPLPSDTYRPGQPVSIYYEVYGLSKDDFGQTHYRMDYRIEPKQGKPIAVTILRAVGKLLGIETKKVVTISYEQKGAAATEYNDLQIDVSGSEAGRYALKVTVTDLNSGQTVSKQTVFGLGR